MADANTLNTLAAEAKKRTKEDFKVFNEQIYVSQMFDFPDLAENAAVSFGKKDNKPVAYSAAASDNPNRFVVMVSNNDGLTTANLEGAATGLKVARAEEKRRNEMVDVFKEHFGEFSRSKNELTFKAGVADPLKLKDLIADINAKSSTGSRQNLPMARSEKGDDGLYHLIVDMSRSTKLPLAEIPRQGKAFIESRSSDQGQEERFMMLASEKLDTPEVQALQGRTERNPKLVSKDSDGKIYLQVPFDSEESAKAVKDKLQHYNVFSSYATVSIVPGDNQKSYYLRFDDLKTQQNIDSAGANLPAAGIELGRVLQAEKDARTARDARIGVFLQELGGTEELQPLAKGREYRLKDSFNDKEKADTAVAALNESIKGLARLSDQQTDGSYVVLVDTSKLTDKNVKELNVAKTVVAFGAARDSQNAANKAAKEHAEHEAGIAALTQQLTAANEKWKRDGEVITLINNFEDRGKADAVLTGFNSAGEGFATLGASSQIAFDFSKYKGGSSIADGMALLPAKRLEDNDAKRDSAFAALQNAFGDTEGKIVQRNGKGVTIVLTDVTVDVEDKIADALGINNTNKDQKVTINDLLDTKGKDHVQAAAILNSFRQDQAFEADRKSKEDLLVSELAGGKPAVRGNDKSQTSIFLASEAEASAVERILGDDVAKKVDNNPTMLTIDLQKLDTNKVADAKKEIEAIRTQEVALKEAQVLEDQQRAEKLAAEEKKKKEAKDQTNQWINIGGPIIGAIVGLFLGGGFSIGGIVSAIAVAGAAWLGAQAYTKTGMFAENTNPAPTPGAGNLQANASQTPGLEQNMGMPSPGYTPTVEQGPPGFKQAGTGPRLT